jgi:integrase
MDGRKWKAMIDQGQDPAIQVPVPAPEPEPERVKLKTVWAEFAKVVVPTRAGAYQYEVRRYWERHLEPEWGEMDIVDIDSGMVNRFLDERTHSVSNKLFDLISNLYKFAKRYYPKDVWANPTEGRVRYAGGITERRLAPDEAQKWATAWVKSRNTHKYMLMWLLLTGSREGVVLNYRPEWRIAEDRLVFDGSEPGLKGALYVVMPKVAQGLVAKFKKTDCNTLWRASQAIAADAGIPPLSPHDLRRSFATFGVDIEIADDVIESLLNHSRGKVTRAYLKRNVDPLVEPANRIANHIVGLLGIDIDRW